MGGGQEQVSQSLDLQLNTQRSYEVSLLQLSHKKGKLTNTLWLMGVTDFILFGENLNL